MKRAKHKIYLQICAAFFAIYLLLMAGFTAFTLHQTAQYWNASIHQNLVQSCNEIWPKLKELTDENGVLTDPDAFTAFMLNRLPDQYGFFKQEGVLFNKNLDVLFSTADYNWLLSYPVPAPSGKGNTNAYGTFFPEKWCSAEQLSLLEDTRKPFPKPKQAGDFSGYSVMLQQYYFDGLEAIPLSMSIDAMYVDSIDDTGSYGSSSRESHSITFPNQREGAIRSGGWLSDWRADFLYFPLLSNRDAAACAQLQADALNADYAKQYLSSYENPLHSTLFSQHIYTLIPYDNLFYSSPIGAGTYQGSAPYYAVFTCHYYPFEFCQMTLFVTWGTCLLVFALAALLLAHGTYNTYEKQEKLERQRRETGIALAHDLKTPLAIIAGCAENLLEHVHTEKRDEYARNIQRKAMHMDKLLQEILQISSLGIRTLQKQPLALEMLCRDLVGVYQDRLDEKQLNVQVEGMQTILGDTALLTRVVENFFTNALRFTPPNGTITVTLAAGRFTMENSGSHIPEGELPKLWEAYHKADPARRDTEGGGLGLYCAAQILDLHHFSYGAENTETGVAFWFEAQSGGAHTQRANRSRRPHSGYYKRHEP